MSEDSAGDADLIVRGVVRTMDSDRPRVEAFAVRGGKIAAIGRERDIHALAGPGTRLVEAADGIVLPGLIDVHSHIGFGGQAAAWELPLPLAVDPGEILAAVSSWAAMLGPGEWVIGGVVISPVFRAMGTRAMLEALDNASLGRPVMLRDDSLHNRWVNSRALEILGINAASPDPAGGAYARDADGPVGLLLEQASTEAELAVRRSIRDTWERDLKSARTAIAIFNAAGITATQDAATMGAWLDVFNELDRRGQLNAWLVGSLPAREFIESGPTGPALFDTAAARRTAHVRPDFVKAVLDGVPMTRTSKFLDPYQPSPETDGHRCPFHGDGLFTDQELRDTFEAAISRGLNVKLHATGDATVRQALNNIELMRERYGDVTIFHIAHPEFVHPDDVARFDALGVIADASPMLWFPGPMNAVIAQQVQPHYMERIWPFADLCEAGAVVAAGSDWPVAAPAPDPWLSIQTMITRRGIDPAFPGTLAVGQALNREAAFAAHTVNAARAMGLGNVTGKLSPGMSADFILVDQDVFTVPVERIRATRVKQTWFNGRLVHDVFGAN
jgi:predicted amidohydrolase YtcJ